MLSLELHLYLTLSMLKVLAGITVNTYTRRMMKNGDVKLSYLLKHVGLRCAKILMFVSIALYHVVSAVKMTPFIHFPEYSMAKKQIVHF